MPDEGPCLATPAKIEVGLKEVLDAVSESSTFKGQVCAFSWLMYAALPRRSAYFCCKIPAFCDQGIHHTGVMGACLRVQLLVKWCNLLRYSQSLRPAGSLQNLCSQHDCKQSQAPNVTLHVQGTSQLPRNICGRIRDLQDLAELTVLCWCGN